MIVKLAFLLPTVTGSNAIFTIRSTPGAKTFSPVSLVMENSVALAPVSARTSYDLGNLLSHLGQWEESVEAYTRSCDLGKTQDPCAHYAYALYGTGREVEAREAGRRASDMNDEPWSTYHLACYYALAGDRAEALHLLQRSLELGYADEGIADNPDLSLLHGDPEFESIVAEVK